MLRHARNLKTPNASRQPSFASLPVPRRMPDEQVLDWEARFDLLISNRAPCSVRSTVRFEGWSFFGGRPYGRAKCPTLLRRGGRLVLRLK